MTTALIKINGVLGENLDLISGTVCTLTNNDDTGVLTWAWVLTSVPDGSSATLSGAATATATFTPDIIGSYIISLTVNASLTDEDIDGSVGRIETLNTGQYIPGTFETTQAGDGIWSIRLNNLLRENDIQLVRQPFTGYNNSGGAYSQDDIVYPSTDYTTKGLPYILKASSTGKPAGIVTSGIGNGSKGLIQTYGRYVCLSFDTSTANVGDPVFSTTSGSLTLTRTKWVVGMILEKHATTSTLFLDFQDGVGFRVREVFLPIEWAEDGAVAPSVSETIIQTNGKIRVRKFSNTASEDIVFPWIVPENIWAGLGVTFISQLLITESTAPSSEGIATVLSGYSRGDGDSLTGTFGTEVESRTGDISDAQYDLRKTEESGTVSITDLAGGETAMLKFYRDHDSVNDTYGQEVGIVGIKLFYVEKV